MRYFELLNLRREPFSNSPDPDLFYRTKQHRECLQALEIAIRLKRGLSVVTGHVGTGKTTLCRQLIRVLDGRQGVVTHLILDPSFTDAREFLAYLAGLFGLEQDEAARLSDWEIREFIKSALFGLAVEEDMLVALIIDEGQKIGLECLEVLRELLNYETNEHKLLQIVIFGQLEFEPILEAKANLADRVNLRFRIGPLDFQDTRELIQARLAMCSKDISPEGLFSFWAFLAVYLATDGFPRQIVQLCHQALLAVIIKEKPRVTWGVVRSCMRWRTLGLPRRRRRAMLMGLALAAVVLLAGGGAYAVLDPGGASRAVKSAGAMTRGAMSRAALWWEQATASSPPSSPGDKAPAGEDQAAQASSKVQEAKDAGPAAGTGAPGAPGETPVQAGADRPDAAGPGQGSSTISPQAGRSAPEPGTAPVAEAANTDSQTPSGQAPFRQAPGSKSAAATGAQSGQASQSTPQPSTGEQAATPGSSGVEQAPDAGPAPVSSPGQDSGPVPGPQADSAGQADSGPPRLTGVEASQSGDAQVVDILLSRPAERFEVTFKPNPSRVLVDIQGLWGRFADRELRVGAGRIDKVRNAIQTDKLRVAIYLRDASAGPVRPEVEKTPRGLRVILK